MVGPSVTLSVVLFDYGANHLAGFCVTDGPKVFASVARGGMLDIFDGGTRVNWTR